MKNIEELLIHAPAIITWERLRSKIGSYMAIEFSGIKYDVEFIKENQEIKIFVEKGYSDKVRQYLIENIIPITFLLTVENL